MITSQSIAAELQELRSRLTDLLAEFKRAEDRYDERGVELSNLQTSFNHFADHEEYCQPATSVRTPKTASMVLTTSTSSITPYTYYSLTSSIVGAEGTRSDRESIYHDFMSLLSTSTIGTTNSVSTYRTARANIEVESAGSSIDTVMQHTSAARRICDSTSRQIFVKGLQPDKSIVVNLEHITTLDDLLRYLQDRTGINPRVISLFHGSRKLSLPIVDLPSNATVMATIICASFGYHPGRMAELLTMRYPQFLVQSCDRVHKMLDEDEYFMNSHFSKNNHVLSDIADHYWRDDCNICQALCWKTVDDEVKAQMESSVDQDNIDPSSRSLLHTESLKHSIQTRIKRTSIKSIFRYQRLDMYKD